MSNRRGLVGKELKPASQPVKAGPSKPAMGQIQGALISKQPPPKKDLKDPKDPTAPGGAVSRNILTAPEVSERLKVSEEAVKEWLKKGLLRGSSTAIQNYELEKFKAGYPGEITRAQKHRLQLSQENPPEETTTKKIQLKKATEKPGKLDKKESGSSLLEYVISIPGAIVSALQKLAPSKKKRSKEDAASAQSQMGLSEGKIPPLPSAPKVSPESKAPPSRTSRNLESNGLDSGQLRKSDRKPTAANSDIVFDDVAETKPPRRAEEGRPAPPPARQPSQEVAEASQERPAKINAERLSLSSGKALPPVPETRGPAVRRDVLDMGAKSSAPTPPQLHNRPGRLQPPGSRMRSAESTPLTAPPPRESVPQDRPSESPLGLGLGAPISQPTAPPDREPAPSEAQEAVVSDWLQFPASVQAPTERADEDEWLQPGPAFPSSPISENPWASSESSSSSVAELAPLADPFSLSSATTAPVWAASEPHLAATGPAELPPLLDPFAPPGKASAPPTKSPLGSPAQSQNTFETQPSPRLSDPNAQSFPLAPISAQPSPEVGRLSDELEALKLELSEEKRQREEAKAHINKLLIENEALQREKQQKAQDEGNSHSRAQEAISQVQALRTQLDAALTQLEASRAHQGHGDAQVKAVQTQLQSAESRIQTAESRLHSTEAQLRASQAQNEKSETQIHALMSQQRQAESQLQANQAQQRQVESQLAALQSQCLALKTQLAEAQRASQEPTTPPEVVRNLENELWGAREALETIRAQHSDSVRQATAARARVLEAEQRIAQLEQENLTQILQMQTTLENLKSREESLATLERQQLATQRENLVLLRERQEAEKQWQEQVQELRQQIETEREHTRITEDKYSHILAQKDKELRELQKKNSQQGPSKEEFGANQAELEETKVKLQDSTKRLKALEQKHSTQIQRWEKELQAAGTWVGKLTEAVQVKDKKISELEGLLANSQNRSKSPEESQLTAQLMAARVELNSLKRHYETAQQTVRNQERELHELQQEKGKLKLEIEEARGTSTSSAEKGLPLLQQDLRHSQELVKQLETEVVATIVKLAAVEREKLDLEARLRELSGDV